MLLRAPAVSAGGRSGSEKLFSFATDRDVLSACCCCGDAVGSTVAGRLRSGEAAVDPAMDTRRRTVAALRDTEALDRRILLWSACEGRGVRHAEGYADWIH
jgi:hypothetical protein